MNKDVLVLVNGYGCSTYAFFRMAHYLKRYFKLIIMDIPGMGLSSRNQFINEFETHQDWMAYFISRMKRFFDLMKLDQFIMAGHSIGGYICTYYFDKYKNQIKKLILLSPAGFNPVTNDFLSNKRKQIR